jgi:hypothetical protein
MKKKFSSFLGLFAISILSTLAVGCVAETAPDSSNESIGEADLALTGTAPLGTPPTPVTYCVTGTINLIGVSPTVGSFNLPVVGCDPSPITFALPPGTYDVAFTLNPGTNTGLPATAAGCQVLSGLAMDQMLVSCSFVPGPQLVVVGGETVQMALAFQFQLNDQQQPTIVFGVGAGEFSIAPGATVASVCGPVLASAVQCAMDASCLGYNGTPAQCYENCDFVEGAPLQDDCASSSTVCMPVVPTTGAMITDLDLVAGACISST